MIHLCQNNEESCDWQLVASINDSDRSCALISWYKTWWECKDSVFCRGTRADAAQIQRMSHLASFPGFTFISWEDEAMTSSGRSGWTLVRGYHVWMSVTLADPHFHGLHSGTLSASRSYFIKYASPLQSQPDLCCRTPVFSVWAFS